MLEISISNKILTISSDFKNHRGGIGAVVNTYSKYFTRFNFISSYPSEKQNNILVPIFYFVYALSKIFIFLLLNRKIRIVHLHCAAKGSFYRKYLIFVVSKYFFRKKVIFHSHGSEMEDFYNKTSGIKRKIFQHFINHTDCILCLSPQWEFFFKTHFKPLKLMILENIIERPIHQSLIRSDREKQVIFLFLGLIGKRKGIFDLIDIIIQNKVFLLGKAKFIIGGNGEVDKLNQLIQSNQLYEIVDFVGWTTGDEKKRLLSECDVFLLPSYNEGLPIAILEAMSYGKAIIATDIGGIMEVVKNGKNGFIFTPGDKPALLDIINFFIAEPQTAISMGKKSFDFIEPYYDVNVLNKLKNVYLDLLK